ncbi:MAG TPA: hypothetical protein VGS01_10950 [Candidatus Limnocylindria bacterium]|nr:hypothetical protein [Candidatus Limnocylindria bacterium]
MERLVTLGITQVGEAREDPVQTLPVVVDAPVRSGAAELIATGEQRLDPRRPADVLAQRADLPRIRLLAEHVDTRLPADRRVGRREERLDDRADAVHQVMSVTIRREK